MKIKNKKIFFIITVLFLFLTKGSVLAGTHCSCADKDKKKTEVIGTNISDEAFCSHTCASKSYPFYRFGDLGSWGKAKPSQLLNTTPVSEPTPEPTANYAAGPFTYVPMEEIPGFGRPVDFPSYIMAIYKFGLWTVGMAGMLMITIGGYMYLTSGGNTSQTGKAKEIITDSIAAIILAMVSWLILYVINPELVAFNSLSAKIDEAAKNYQGSYPDVKDPMPSNCKAKEWQDLFAEVEKSSGVDRCILQAVAAKESGCTQVPNRTYGGRDCSVVQVAALQNCGQSCDYLEQNPKAALECAAKYLKKCSSSVRQSPPEQKIRDTYAGYNGGCGALGSSKSCQGMTNDYGNPYQKWDCPVDCGGYCPVPARTSVFLDYYNQCKGK